MTDPIDRLRITLGAGGKAALRKAAAELGISMSRLLQIAAKDWLRVF